MKDINEILKFVEDRIAAADEKVNEQLSALYDKLDEYRDAFRKNVYGEGKTVTVDIDLDIDTGGDKRTAQVNADGGKKTKSKDDLVKMAPFLDKESLHELVVEFLEGDLETEMWAILPFLDERDIALIVGKFKKEGIREFKGLRVENLFPFASDIYLDELFMEKFLQGEIDESLIPFVSAKCLHELVVKYCEDEESNLNIDGLYPFLNKDDLKLLFKTYLTRRSKK